MRAIVFFLLFFFLSCTPKVATVIEKNPTIPSSDFQIPEKVFYFFENGEWVEGVPDELPGKDDNLEFLKEMNKVLRYPALARENGIQGVVLITVVQDETGQILESTIKKGIGGGCEEEALRAVRVAAAKIKLKPISNEGIPRKVKYDWPIKFSFA